MIKRKSLLILMTMVLLVTYNVSIPVWAEENTSDHTDEELKANDYILYFVNAGDKTPESVEGNDKLGLYASKTEQTYGVDEVTGKTWGLVTTTTNHNVSDETNKYGTLRYYNGDQTRDKAIEYKFELPDGEYDITLGFKNPWSGRSVNLIGEGQNLSNGDYQIGEYGEEKEFTYRQLSVSDGELDIRIQGPASANLTNYNDPLVNFIIIRKYVVLPLADLEDKIAEAKVEADKTDTYTKYSLAPLNTAIEQAESLVDSITVENLNIGAKEVQEDIRSAIHSIDTAMKGLTLDIPNESFKPGQEWRDTNGAVIQAHGAGIMYDEKNETYYWYGEDKTNGYLPATGVHAYSSKDLYNWEDEGVVLRAVEKREDLDEDPYLEELYKNRSKEEKDVIFSDINSERGVLERPKVIYNEKTDKYVLWLHVDGPYQGSDSNYAKAKAGVAISDSPTGPFEYLESNRLNKMPEGYEYRVQNTGMSRDMNLFVDDDGTAYIIYSSEENYSLYISKLNDDYTAIAGEEYGKDFTRAIYNGHREAPAMFKYDGKYYLITSGATGWDPNPAKYHVANSVLGEWTTVGDPSIGEGASTTFGSQSTNVIPVDPKNGKFIFMGDRWNKNDLKNSRYVWLPIEFGQEDEIILQWYDEWTLDILDRMGRVTVNTKLPEKVSVNQVPTLPEVINVTNSEGKQIDTPVSWSINAEDFSKPGTVVVEGMLTKIGDKVIRIEILVIPEHVRYFVHAGGAETKDYKIWTSYMQDTLINKDIIDQMYDPENGQAWGYVGDISKPAGTEDDDLFSSLRYLLSGKGDDLSYKFDLEDGKYTVYVGLFDRWYGSTRGSRKADIVINGETKTRGYVFTNSYDTLGYDVDITDGKLDVTVRRVSGSPDPQISWIMIVEQDTKGPVISFTGNEETYSIDSKIDISCDAVDDLSGIASINCPEIAGNAYEHKVGVNEFLATATDNEGNTSEVKIQFTVTVDFDSLSRLTESFVSKDGIAYALTQKLESAKAANAKGNKKAVEGSLGAYVNQLSAQSGKAISEQDAERLNSLSSHLK